MGGLCDGRRKEYKKITTTIATSGKMGKIPRGNSSDAIPKKTMPKEIMKALRDHQDKQPYEESSSPKVKGMQEYKLRGTSKTLHAAATTRRQLQALEKNITTQGSTVRLSKTLTTKTNPGRKN